MHIVQLMFLLSHSLFRLLADNPDKPAPYDTDLADQRAKYGESLLRRAPDQIEKQETYEKEQSAKHEIAKQKRAEEKARLDEIQVSSVNTGTATSLLTFCSNSDNVSKPKRHVWRKRRQFVNDSVRKLDLGEKRSSIKKKKRVSRNRRGQKVELGQGKTRSQ